MLGQVRKEIQEQNTNAEYILNEVKKKYASMFERVADGFLKKKSESIKYIAEQIIRELMLTDREGLGDIKEPVIVVADDFESADIIQLDSQYVLAIVSQNSAASLKHSIEAGGLAVPVVTDAKGILEGLQSGMELIVDGNSGDIIINPSEEEKNRYFKKVDHEKEMLDIYEEYISKKTMTKDGSILFLSANTEKVAEVEEARLKGADSIGVVYTDFIYEGRHQDPDVDTQFNAYRDIVVKAGGRALVFSSFYGEGIPYLRGDSVKNPLMSKRGIRLALAHSETFKKQLEAILMASAFGPVSLLFPLVTSFSQIIAIKGALAEAKKALDDRGDFYDPDLKIGLTIDTPWAVMMMGHFSKEVDFFVVNTTDLIRYTHGVDEKADGLTELYEVYSPAVIGLLRIVTANAKDKDLKVSVTGDMTGMDCMIPLLAALGFDGICLRGDMIPKARWAISRVDVSLWTDYLKDLEALASAEEIKTFLSKIYEEDVVGSES